MPSVVSQDQILREALQAHGQRFTGQRAAVYRFLCDTRSHPTAEDVFFAVRTWVPGISLATVYKSLEALVGCGLANRLHPSGDASARYDGCLDPHYHARCERCDRLIDVPGHVELHHLTELARSEASFTVTGVELELTGICASCSEGDDLKG